MKYRIEWRTLALNDKSSAATGKLALAEADQDGNIVNGPFYPHNGTIEFVAEKLTIIDEIGYSTLHEDNDFRIVLSFSQRIIGRLILGPNLNSDYDPNPTFSMFGSQEEIQEANIEISLSSESTEKNPFTCWGSPGFTTNFLGEPENEVPPIVWFYYKAPKDVFTRITELVQLGKFDRMSFQASDVCGFYSERSALGDVRQLKVLANADDQKVEFIDSQAKDLVCELNYLSSTKIMFFTEWNSNDKNLDNSGT
ncbi:MAG: hypothetical protein ACK4K8_15815 [Pannonibacter sp.]